MNYEGNVPGRVWLFHFGVPLICGILFGLLKTSPLQDDFLTALLTIHGIFLSVLMGSFSPLLDLETKAINTQKTTLNSDEKLENAKQTVKAVLFSVNSLTIFISLIIVVLIFTAQFLVYKSFFISFFQSIYSKADLIIYFIFHAALGFLVVLNLMNIFSLLQVIHSTMSSVYFKKCE